MGDQVIFIFEWGCFWLFVVLRLLENPVCLKPTCLFAHFPNMF